MQTIGAYEAKTRLSELLDRAAAGEAFEITKHDRPVARLLPPEGARDKKAAAEALARLLAMRGAAGALTAAELKAMVREGHRY